MATKSLYQQRLRPEVAEKYTATIPPCVIDLHNPRRRIDMTKLTVADVEELVQDPQFTYLVAKKTRKAKQPPGVG
ncbi:hypothetical protein [Hymenobacter chitinivorans]|uniref:Uncharacterized protein n=1 Tax=Hymenobacter chitinivorans DSM 11115 TaxID=1121954 RepID=A0A2M9BNB0_9BACT|nr:hypothetical protein [Hymenobacter chitinivorans]PJJ59433.1 hypothetical protein CLV45_0850 [Hymenobacter chitinivorans DSM 11115]